MKIGTVCNLLPYFLFYTDNIPDNFAGKTYYNTILIKKDYKEDLGLLEHEKTHVKQFYKLFGIIHNILYTCSTKYRLKSEIEAYAVQLIFNKQQERKDYITFYAKRITELYNLKIDLKTAEILLQNKVEELL